MFGECDHEDGLSDCLRSSTAATAMGQMDAVVATSRSDVQREVKRLWNRFYQNDLQKSGWRARAITSAARHNYFWNGWIFDYASVLGKNGQHSC